MNWLLRLALWTGAAALAGFLSILIVIGIAMAVAFPNLPDISDLSDYRPKLPLRVYSAEGDLIGEFGEERRQLTPIKEIPKIMTDAVLAIEDSRFYEHGGVDYKGMLRAGFANLGRFKSQGASTITMQVARNVYLSSEKTYTRKIYEILLTFKLEHMLTKDQILEIYMNQIFLGNRAYGFAAASEAYFGKPLKDITIAEAAMLAGLPKAPSAYNPISNPNRARSRQLHIIERMEENGFITAALDDHPDNGDVMSAMVLEADTRHIKAVRQNGEAVDIVGEGLKPAQSGLSDKAPPHIKIRRGAIIRVTKTAKNTWEITQLPEVEGAFVALDPRDGSIKALVGGFDFEKNKFNHVTQAWRQPGSSFKPFIYSSALEKGFTPATVINDSPLFFDAGVTGGQPWEPKNYDGKFEGPMTLRQGLAKSKNMISIRILQAVGAQYAQEWITRFGFDQDKHPPYLTMALGAGSVTPMQMVSAYSVFANGGYRINPWLITKVTEQKGKLLVETKPPVLDESMRAIDARNAFMMESLLQTVTRSGTAASAQATLKRPDLYGKTGTTNDSMDAWFAGFQPTLAAVTWIGYDTPRKLGDRETGGGLSLPVWIRFMEHALKNVPIMEPDAPEGVVHTGGEWFYDEYAKNAGISSLGLGEKASSSAGLPAADERKNILDLFRN